MKKTGCSGKVRIHHCENPAVSEKLEALIKETFPETSVTISTVGGLCGFYAERGGVLIGYES